MPFFFGISPPVFADLSIRQDQPRYLISTTSCPFTDALSNPTVTQFWARYPHTSCDVHPRDETDASANSIVHLINERSLAWGCSKFDTIDRKCSKKILFFDLDLASDLKTLRIVSPSKRCRDQRSEKPPPWTISKRHAKSFRQRAPEWAVNFSWSRQQKMPAAIRQGDIPLKIKAGRGTLGCETVGD